MFAFEFQPLRVRLRPFGKRRAHDDRGAANGRRNARAVCRANAFPAPGTDPFEAVSRRHQKHVSETTHRRSADAM